MSFLTSVSMAEALLLQLFTFQAMDIICYVEIQIALAISEG